MDEPPATQFDEQIQVLERLSARVQSGDVPDRAEIDGALERGFGRLVALEAELQRMKRAPGVAGNEERVPDLRHAIEILRQAIVELRAVSSPPGPPRIGYGFVLPESALPTRHREPDGTPPPLPRSSPEHKAG